MLAACSGPPPSWDVLITQRIAAERPQCAVSAPSAGWLDVRCAEGKAQRIEVAPIAQFCQRGPRDCEYAIDQMLLGLH